MHRYFFATKDAFINSGSNVLDGTTFQDKNTGQDEILELKKYYYNDKLHGSTRALIQYDADEIENYISSSVLPSTYKLNLRLWETKGTSGLSETYKIAAYPLSQSWDEGVGKEADEPKTTDGVSWKYRKNSANAKEIPWSKQYPEGESVDGAFASASINLSNWQLADTQSLFIIKNSRYAYPEVNENVFMLASNEVTNPNFDRFYAGNGNYLVGGSGSIDYVGGLLRDVINLYKLGTSPFTETLVLAQERTITSRHHTILQRDGGALLPYSASWDGTNLHLTASRTGVAYNDIVISTGSYSNDTDSYATSSDTPFGGGFGTIILGAGGNYARTPQSTQTFSLESPDIEIDITDIGKTWFGGTIPNYGLLLRLSGSSAFYQNNPDGDYELSSGSFEDLKFFT